MTACTMSSETCQNFCGSGRRKRAGSIVVKVRPALLTRICGVPNRCCAVATTRSHSAGWRRSATSGRTCPAKLAPAVSASTSATSASMWPTATTSWPARARPNAIARPRPRNPPVTIATRRSIDPSLWYPPDPQCTYNSKGIRPNPCPPLLQKAAHRRVGLKQDRLRIGGVRARPPTETGQQVGARRPVRLIPDQARVPLELVERRQPGCRPRRLAQRHRAIDRNDRRMRQRLQPIIELENGMPVGRAADPSRGMHRLHGRLELEPPDPAQAARLLQQPLGFVDRRGIRSDPP